MRTSIKARAIVTFVSSLVVACLLSVVRGGFDAVPFIVFFGGVFTLAVAAQAVYRRESLASIEAVLRRLPFATTFRYALVFGVLLVLLVWSGSIITSGGFAGWLVALLVGLFAPAIVCPLAPRYPILFGILSAGCISFSLAVHNSRLYSHSREIQWSHVLSDPGIQLVMWGIAAALSLLVSIPVYVHRRAA